MRKKLRLLLTVCAAAFLSVPGMAGAESPVEKFLEILRTSCVNMECRYELYASGTVYKGAAAGQVQSTAYRIKAGGFEFFCDGGVLWTLDYEAGEAVIEPVEDAVAISVSNPVRLFAELGDSFEVVRSSSENGRWTYIMAAKAECGIKTAEIVLSSAGILLKGNFMLSDGSRMKTEVVSMTSSAAKPLSYFRPDTDFSDWVVTDLR